MVLSLAGLGLLVAKRQGTSTELPCSPHGYRTPSRKCLGLDCCAVASICKGGEDWHALPGRSCVLLSVLDCSIAKLLCKHSAQEPWGQEQSVCLCVFVCAFVCTFVCVCFITFVVLETRSQVHFVAQAGQELINHFASAS